MRIQTRSLGRSALFRRAAADHLRRHRREAIASAYRAAYGDATGLGKDWTGWEDEGDWPER
jgi:hypothetical protein